MTTAHHPGTSDTEVEPSVPTSHSCLELQEAVLIYDRENPERWIQAAESVVLLDCR
ncbi:hypothetical protein SAMN04487948_11240 [Halogranum amylolyticum]|uniref:Uncharacterized protein n=1 Tax=Halogranum amylolyticum TaxID=660520 RepID=A0A1H8USC1_9EURY|nr:hypothetical protein [Halogranum amylolyticum]SEP05488.1 hypothetical protein SAMN04487948_11240 [Halogranum amylolyticum]